MNKTAKRQSDELYRLRHAALIRQRGAAKRQNNIKRYTIEELRAKQASNETKRCGICHLEKLLAEFNLNRTMPSGFDSMDKTCRKAEQKRYAALKRDRAKGENR